MQKKIVNLIAKVKTNEREELLNKLKQLYDKHPTNEIALEYARGISVVIYILLRADSLVKEAFTYILPEYSVAESENELKALELLNKLKQLYDKHPTNEIALVYAKGIANLILKVETKEGEKWLKELQKLYDKHPTNEIALEYARGIYNLVLKLKNERKEKEAKEWLDKLHKFILDYAEKENYKREIYEEMMRLYNKALHYVTNDC